MARIREFNTADVLEKAINLFWHKGYNGVSTQDLIDAFGISKSSMYAAFGNKKNLFIAALEKYQHDIANDTIKKLQDCVLVKNEIRVMLTATLKRSLSDKNSRGCFVVNTCVELAPHSSEIAAMLKKHKKKIEAAFADAVKRGIGRGELSGSISPEASAMVISNAITGIQVDAKYIRDKKYFENVINGVMMILD